jgi:hypothetical protein
VGNRKVSLLYIEGVVMIRNKQSTRAFIAFLVTWAFVVLTVTGLVLYIVPKGRVAFWIQWSLFGLGKEGWGDVHILFGGIFIVTGILHLYFNWKPFCNYLAKRIKGHLELKQELLTSLVATILLIVGAIAAVPPISWVFDLNEQIKTSWAHAPGHEPPFGHAEEVALPALARRTNFELSAAIDVLRAANIRIDDERSTLLRIAEANGTTPAALYALILKRRVVGNPMVASRSPLEIEERLAGTGIGGKTLVVFSGEQNIELNVATDRLKTLGIQAAPEDKLKSIAESAGVRPIEIAKAVLVPGYRPQPTK